MKHRVGEIRKLWVYNEETGSLTYKNLIFRSNSIESWYEESDFILRTHDPYFVDINKMLLVNRVVQMLNRKLMKTLMIAEELTNKLKKLHKVK